jgi:hypothetical protein
MILHPTQKFCVRTYSGKPTQVELTTYDDMGKPKKTTVGQKEIDRIKALGFSEETVFTYPSNMTFTVD